MKETFLSTLAIVVLFLACTTTQQRAAYNTIATTQALATAAVDSYYTLVIQGKLSTNDVPSVTTKYDAFQASVLVMLAGVRNNTNALAPGSLILESQDLIKFITALKKAQK